MAKNDVPEYLPISPITLVCPLCGALADRACESSSGGALELVHVARIKLAAKMDLAGKKKKSAAVKKRIAGTDANADPSL